MIDAGSACPLGPPSCSPGHRKRSATRWGLACLLALVGMGARPTPTRADDAATPEFSPVLEFSVVDSGPEHPWVMMIENRGGTNARLAVDPRLAWFEVNVPGKLKPVSCVLPDALRPDAPSDDTDEILEPGGRVMRRLDGRLFCFTTSSQQSTLVPGAVITSHFGWPEKTKTVWRGGRRVEEPLPPSPPYIVRPEDRDDAGLRQLTAPPFTLSEAYSAWSEEATALEDSALELSVVRGSDAQEERTATIQVSIRNKSQSSQRLFFRRDLLAFDVLGPDGQVSCEPGVGDREPAAQAFISLRPGGSQIVDSRLVELCPRGTFQRPGLYLVNASLDASGNSGETQLTSFTGRLSSRRPVSVRIRTGELPFLTKPKAEKKAETAGSAADEEDDGDEEDEDDDEDDDEDED